MNDTAKMGAFARATAELGTKRPLRDPHLRRIVAEMREGNAQAAGSAPLAHLAGNPDDADALFLMGRALYRQDRREEALEHLQRCLNAAPDFTAARCEYAKQLAEMNRFAAALAELDIRACRRSGQSPLPADEGRRVLGNIGDNAESTSLYEALAQENPDRAEGWIAYGHALRVSGSSQQSIAAYRRAIATRASCGQPYWSLANLKTFRFDPADIAPPCTKKSW